MVSLGVRPYQMCSRKECEDRQRCNEVSIWEQLDDVPGETGRKPWNNDNELAADRVVDADPNQSQQRNMRPPSARGRSGRGGRHRGGRGRGRNNHHGPRHHGKTSLVQIDPQKAVQKYRRSAAGSHADGASYRSIEDLNVSVDYLLHLLAHGVHCSKNDRNQTIKTFRSLVEFVENRIRAVQTDWVKLQGSEARPDVLVSMLQVKIARMHILVLYLMADTPGYERTFGKRALSTALSQYWDAWQDHPDERHSMDEMLAYSTLFQLQQDLCDHDKNTNAPASAMQVTNKVLDSYRNMLLLQYRPQPTDGHPSRLDLPRFGWALELVKNANLGLWHSLLQRLSFLPLEGESLGAMAKCLLAPALGGIRYKALQALNVAWRKGEGVTGAELARLLHLPTANSAVEFAQHCGLPVETSNHEDTDEYTNASIVLLQSVPIQPFDSVPTMAVRDNDNFVFSSWNQCDGVKDNGVGNDDPWTVDVEGLSIPPQRHMESLLFHSF